MERKQSSRFRRIFKVAFLLILPTALAGGAYFLNLQSFTFTQHEIHYQKVLRKYDETVFFPWSDICLESGQSIERGGDNETTKISKTGMFKVSSW